MARAFNIEKGGNISTPGSNSKPTVVQKLLGTNENQAQDPQNNLTNVTPTNTERDYACLYPRSKLRQIIKELKQFKKNHACENYLTEVFTPYDPCTLDDAHLVPPAAELEVNIIPDDIVTISNEACTVTCNSYNSPFRRYAQEGDYFVALTPNNYEKLRPTAVVTYTVEAGTFVRKLTNPTENQIAEVQEEVNALALNYAIARLTCGYVNKGISLKCPISVSDQCSTSDLGRTPNLNALLLDGLSSDATVNAGEYFVAYPDDGGDSYGYSPATEKELIKDLNSQVFSSLISRLSCVYGNEEIQLVCSDFPESFVDQSGETVNTSNVVHTIDYDTTQTISLGTIYESLSSKSRDTFYVIDPTTTAITWNYDKYKNVDAISTQLSCLALETVDDLKEQAEQRLLASSSCGYGNIETAIVCPDGFNAMVEDDLNSIITKNTFVDTIPANDLDTDDESYLQDSNTWVLNAVVNLDTLIESIYDYIKLQIDIRYNSYISYSCGIYNNTIYVFCDKKTAENALSLSGDDVIFQAQDGSGDLTYFRFYLTNQNNVIVPRAVNTDVPVSDLKLAINIEEYLDAANGKISNYYPDGVYAWEHNYPDDQKVGDSEVVTIYNDPWQCYPLGIASTTSAACEHSKESPIAAKFNTTTATDGTCTITEVVSSGYPNYEYTNPDDKPADFPYTPIASGERVANDDVGITSFTVIAKSFTELYQSSLSISGVSPSELQTQVNTSALNNARAGLSCMYGNIKIFAEDCSAKISCGASGFFSENINPPEVPENTYFADTPTNADRQAVVAHNAMAFCLCKDWIGGGGGGSSLTIEMDASCGEECGQQYCLFVDD